MTDLKISCLPSNIYSRHKINFSDTINLNSTDCFIAMYRIISLGPGNLPDRSGESDAILVSLLTFPEEINKDVWLSPIQITQVKHI